MSNQKKQKESESVTIELNYPIEWLKDGDGGKESVKFVEFQRPKGKHIKKLDKDIGMEQLLGLASKVSPYTPAFYDEMDASDCMQVVEVMGNFMDAGLSTGKTD